MLYELSNKKKKKLLLFFNLEISYQVDEFFYSFVLLFVDLAFFHYLYFISLQRKEKLQNKLNLFFTSNGGDETFYIAIRCRSTCITS